MDKLRNGIQKYWFWLAVVLGVLALIIIIYSLVGVRPPKELTIATGREGGAYYLFAKEYQRRFAEQGYTLNIRETAGTIETIELLETGEVDVGFVQNTALASSDSSGVTTLAALYYEALWIFNREDLDVDPGTIPELEGLRINAGEAGSAGNQAALGFLNMNGINGQNATITSLPDGEAAQRLKDGDLDVMMTFLGAFSPMITDLLTTPGIELAPVRRAKAYSSLYKNLTEVILPEGVLDLAADIPPADVPLLATRATLVAGPTLHPDLANLFLIFADEIHGAGGIFETPGEFPSPAMFGIPMNADAERYLSNGPTLLERYFPLTVASRLERLLLLLLPVVIIAYPLLRGTLALSHTYYSDRIKWRYRELRRIDSNYKTYDKAQLEETIAVLTDQQDNLASDMSVPTTMLDDLYNLHYNFSLVLDRLNAQLSVLDQEEQQADEA